MRRHSIALITCIALAAIWTTVRAKGQTMLIVIEGDNLVAPVEIADPDILDQFSIWNGPSVRTSGPDGVPHPPAYLDPEQSAGRFIDWPEGVAAEKPSGLQRLEVTFHIGVLREPGMTHKYIVAYEVDTTASRGYIFLPRWKNDLISHGVEGNWFHASQRWDELVMPTVARHSAHSPGSIERGELKCEIGKGLLSADGTVEFVLEDEQGNRLSRWRYETSTPGYQSVRDHIGNVEPGKEIAISCWPARQ